VTFGVVSLVAPSALKPLTMMAAIHCATVCAPRSVRCQVVKRRTAVTRQLTLAPDAAWPVGSVLAGRENLASRTLVST
jgi:hypothetical protein